MRTGRTFAALVVALAGLFSTISCADENVPTAIADGGALASMSPNAGNGGKVKVKQLQLQSNTIRIDGPADAGVVSIGNSGLAIQSGVSMRGEVVQGPATASGFDVPVQCSPNPADAGKLPTGTCDATFSFTVSGLQPGAAVFVLHVLQAGSELASKSVNVTLTGTAGFLSVSLASYTLAIDGPSTTYTAVLENPSGSLQGMSVQGWIVQGTSRRAAGGAVLTCSGANGVFPTGTCTFSFSAGASNSPNNGGSGTLVPGAATFELDLQQTSGTTTTVFDIETVAVTLVSSAPRIVSLQLDAYELPIDGDGVGYTATLQNYGYTVSGVILQGEITQAGTPVTVRAAGGLLIDCGAGLGTLPTTAACEVHFTASASNSAAGNGTLVPGNATFVLRMYRGDPSELIGSVEVAVLLTDDTGCFPDLPKPQLAVESVVWGGIGGSDHVELDVTNYSSFPDVLFAPAPDLPACGANANSSRSWVDVLRGDTGEYIFGFCSFGQASDLNSLWYQVPAGTGPTSVKIRITDRKCNQVYESDPVTLPIVIG